MKRPRSADAQRAVTGALRSAINDHGPITNEKITSAAKRIVGNLKNVRPEETPPGAPPERPASEVGSPLLWARGPRWDNYRAWYERVRDGAMTARERMLEEAWRRAVPDYAERTGRVRDARTSGKEPLDALFNLIEQGYYPPPELLLCLADSFNAYLDDAGVRAAGKPRRRELTLEETFFGKRSQKRGSFAAQENKNPYERRRALDFALRRKERAKQRGESMTDEDAAREAIGKFGLKGIRADTLARSFRKRSRTKKR